MSAYLDELYSEWLYKQVFSSRLQAPSKSFRNLTHILYTTEFLWIVPNDDNRIEDGKSLRHEFVSDMELTPCRADHMWFNLGCSMLELLVVLSRRLEFEIGEPIEDAFMELLDNLGLAGLNDQCDIPEEEVREILHNVIWRTYHEDGVGGLFPLDNPQEDQRKVELWYQLSAYILERI